MKAQKVVVGEVEDGREKVENTDIKVVFSEECTIEDILEKQYSDLKASEFYSWNAWETQNGCTPLQRRTSSRWRKVKFLITVLKLSEPINCCKERSYLGGDDLDVPTLKVMKRQERTFLS